MTLIFYRNLTLEIRYHFHHKGAPDSAVFSSFLITLFFIYRLVTSVFVCQSAINLHPINKVQ